jgi:hypothetical protein
MLKVALITLISAGTLGTGVATFTPQNFIVTAGSVNLDVSAQGVHMNVVQEPEFSVTLTTKGEREFTVRF